MAKVYIVTEEPYHDNSVVYGAYATCEAARAAHGGVRKWLPAGNMQEWWPEERVVSIGITKPETKSGRDDYDDCLYVYEIEVEE